VSFLRPEAQETLLRWAEPAAAGGLALLCAWQGIRWVLQGGSAGWIVIAAGVIALFWLRAAVIGALAARPVTEVGLVVFREGEVGYMSPDGGGFLEFDGLARVEIFAIAAGQEPFWRLVGLDGAVLMIPAAAEGADHLPEALTVLPGFSDMAAVTALNRAERGSRLVWERPGQPLLH
jgi:hypothetical protein